MYVYVCMRYWEGERDWERDRERREWDWERDWKGEGI